MAQTFTQNAVTAQLAQNTTQQSAQMQTLKTTLIECEQQYQALVATYLLTKQRADEQYKLFNVLQLYYPELKHLGYRLLQQAESKPHVVNITPFSQQIATIAVILSDELKIFIAQQNRLLSMHINWVKNIEIIQAILVLGGLLLLRLLFFHPAHTATSKQFVGNKKS